MAAADTFVAGQGDIASACGTAQGQGVAAGAAVDLANAGTGHTLQPGLATGRSRRNRSGGRRCTAVNCHSHSAAIFCSGDFYDLVNAGTQQAQEQNHADSRVQQQDGADTAFPEDRQTQGDAGIVYGMQQDCCSKIFQNNKKPRLPKRRRTR